MPCSRRGAAAVAMLALSVALLRGDPAAATGVAGDRIFPSTLQVEDTQNDDEMDLPTVAALHRGGDGGVPKGRDIGIGADVSRLLTPDLAVLGGTGWQRIDTGRSGRAGWDNALLGLKYRTLVNAPAEFLLSTAVTYEIGGTGARRVGAESFDTVEPVVSFGKGFGDLPREIDWLRPGAVTGAAGIAIPTAAGAKLLRLGATLQYSLLYRDRQIAPVEGPEWLGRMIPLVEFAVETPAGRSYGSGTVASAAPGVAWIGEFCQVTAEVLVPLNRRTGVGVGALAQLHIFLDEAAPSLFGRPVFGGGAAPADRD